MAASLSEELRSAVRRTSAAVLEFVLHTIVVAVMLSCIWATEQVINYLWGQNKKLWGQVPISYVFDTMDFAAIVLMLGYGTVSAMKAYRSNHG